MHISTALPMLQPELHAMISSYAPDCPLEDAKRRVNLGLTLWLDASDLSSLQLQGSNVQVWQSKHTESTHKNRRKLVGDGSKGLPQYQTTGSNRLNAPSVRFNYNATAMISPPMPSIGTVISVHTFHANTGSRSQFYIFAGSQQGPFHGGSKNEVVTGHGSWVSPVVYNGGISVNMAPEEKCADAKIWYDELKLARLTCSHPFNASTLAKYHQWPHTHAVNRIGRDRRYHEFSGSIAELCVFDRLLSAREAREVEVYLAGKWDL